MIIIPRLARKNLNTPFLHVMVQGVNKEYIFNDKKHIEKYLEIISENKKNYNFTIIAYCIMNNHAHFLIYVENIEELGKFMHKCNLLYARMYNEEKKRVGVLFRNRYQTEPIYDIKYLINCIKYIHNNPIKAGMVSACEDYKYSTYKDYINNTGVTQSQIMKKIFGDKCDYSQMFREAPERRLIDVEKEEKNTIEEYIIGGIRQYIKEFSNDISEILSNREKLKKLVIYLKDNCGLSYVEIRNFFEMSKGAMDSLKRC